MWERWRIGEVQNCGLNWNCGENRALWDTGGIIWENVELWERQEVMRKGVVGKTEELWCEQEIVEKKKLWTEQRKLQKKWNVVTQRILEKKMVM